MPRQVCCWSSCCRRWAGGLRPVLRLHARRRMSRALQPRHHLREPRAQSRFEMMMVGRRAMVDTGLPAPSTTRLTMRYRALPHSICLRLLPREPYSHHRRSHATAAHMRPPTFDQHLPHAVSLPHPPHAQSPPNTGTPVHTARTPGSTARGMMIHSEGQRRRFVWKPIFVVRSPPRCP